MKSLKVRKNCFLVVLAFFLQVTIHAQEVRVIDNKGTKVNIRNNTVTSGAVAPTGPVENDTWIDTSDPDHQRAKVWNGSSWVELTFTGIPGSVFFADTDGTPTQENDEFFWDDTNNRLGVGTDTPSAQVDIESTGVPLKIEPSATTPTGTSGGQMFVGDDGILYLYDGTRSKWLSVSRFMVGWGRANPNTTLEYLRQYNGARSSDSGWRMIRDGTITAITAQGNTAQTWTLEIRKNDGIAIIASLSMIAQAGNHDNTLNIDVNEGDFIQAYCNGISIDYPQTLIEIAWRK